MGRSSETIVRVVEIDKLELGYVEFEQYPTDIRYSTMTLKAAKALKGAEPGDRVEVVWDFDDDSYPIVKARRITGTLEARVEALEAALKAAGIDIPEETK